MVAPFPDPECPLPWKRPRKPYRTTLGAALLLALGVAAPAGAVEPYRIGGFSLGMTGGFQAWGLSGLEEVLSDRATSFATNGYDLDAAQFNTTFSYGLDLQFRMTEQWFFRTAGEWTRLKWDDRDRTFLATLGAGSRTPVSLSYETKVQTRPVLAMAGIGTAREFTSIRIAFSGNLVIAPVRVTETVEVAIVDSATEIEVTATGVGTGLEIDAAVDYFTDTSTTLYLEAFWRTGSTDVDLDEMIWEGSSFPGTRRVDFDGIGIRLGLRWI